MIFQHDLPKLNPVQKLELEVERLKQEIESLRAIASERARSDQALRTHLSRLELLADCNPDVILVQSGDMKYLDYWAGSNSKLLVSPEKFIGRRPSDVLPIAISDKAVKCHNLCVQTGISHRYYYSISRESGLVWFRVIMVPHGDRVVSFISRVSDILDDHQSGKIHDIASLR